MDKSPKITPTENGALPPMYFGDTSRVGRPYAKDPAVVRLGNRYLMYYSIPPYPADATPPNAPRGWGIGVAESSDLDHWKKIGEILPEQPCEMNGICAPGARVFGGKVHLFYQTYGNGSKDALCHAVSEDGIHFKRNPTNPIFSPTGSWNNGRAIDADVIPWKDQLLLFFATRDPSGTTQMLGVATAPLPNPNTPNVDRGAWKQLGDGPILKPELSWEKKCIEAAASCTKDGKLWLFYAGGYNNEPQQIGCAVCTGADLTRWQRVSETPLLPNGKPGTWNSSESGHPFVFTDTDSAHHLFYQGNHDKGKTWYLSRKQIEWK